ncbi:MAG: type II toxin-antitoxin system PemK/MazF family toxin [Planctomycetota bacterium]|nr:type II toxin-antitoxin system PemK/MazF family toxin [Planctomycetota bacterium]
MFRGEVCFVDLGPVIGCEINGQKRRPVVVVSIDDINRKPLVVTVVPGTTSGKTFRNVAKVEPSATNGLSRETFFQGHQVRALDHSRFGSQPAGRLSMAEMAAVEDAVRFSLGF